MKMHRLKPCQFCWETFNPKNHNQKFCGKKCKLADRSKKDLDRRQKAIVEGESDAYLKLRFMVLRRDDFTCQYCGRNAQSGAVLHIDHVCPKSNGGKYAFDNLVTSCFECNEGKGDILLTKREQDKLKSRVGIITA